jgi:hypothetical protein
MAQIAKAANFYAGDWKDQLWPMFDWCKAPYRISRQPAAYGTGVLYQYIDNVGKVAECPTNKRTSASGAVQQVSNTPLQNDAEQYGIVPLGVFFDYTMISRFQGVKLGAPITVAYLKAPEVYAAGVKPPDTLPSTQQSAKLKVMTGIPIFAEEDTYFNNSGVTDGLWGNLDQITRRHAQSGNVAFFEGHAGPWNQPASRAAPGVQDAHDLDCNDMYVSRGGVSWIRLESNNDNNSTNWIERPYGWANAPK